MMAHIVAKRWFDDEAGDRVTPDSSQKLRADILRYIACASENVCHIASMTRIETAFNLIDGEVGLVASLEKPWAAISPSHVV
jgi:hypothetical protein